VYIITTITIIIIIMCQIYSETEKLTREETIQWEKPQNQGMKPNEIR